MRTIEFVLEMKASELMDVAGGCINCVDPNPGGFKDIGIPGIWGPLRKPWEIGMDIFIFH